MGLESIHIFGLFSKDRKRISKLKRKGNPLGKTDAILRIKI